MYAFINENCWQKENAPLWPERLTTPVSKTSLKKYVYDRIEFFCKTLQ